MQTHASENEKESEKERENICVSYFKNNKILTYISGRSG